MIYVPDFQADWALSRWTGRPAGLTIDPIGVEATIRAAPVKRRLFARPRPPEPEPYLHALVHTELPSDRIRSWAMRQVAVLAALEGTPEASGEHLNRQADAEAERLSGRDWVPATVMIDGRGHAASVYEDGPTRWAAYVDLGADRLALIGQGLTLAEAPLRTADADEARRLRTDALQV